MLRHRPALEDMVLPGVRIGSQMVLMVMVVVMTVFECVRHLLRVVAYRIVLTVTVCARTTCWQSSCQLAC